jgi:hypothetical protein
MGAHCVQERQDSKARCGAPDTHESTGQQAVHSRGQASGVYARIS